MGELGGRTLDWVDGTILMVDQTKLPTSVEMLQITTVPDLVDAIRRTLCGRWMNRRIRIVAVRSG